MTQTQTVIKVHVQDVAALEAEEEAAVAVKDYARAAAAREQIDALLAERARAEAEAEAAKAKAAAAAAAAGGGNGGFAPKHGVRLLTRALDLQMVLPLLLVPARLTAETPD